MAELVGFATIAMVWGVCWMLNSSFHARRPGRVQPGIAHLVWCQIVFAPIGLILNFHQVGFSRFYARLAESFQDKQEEENLRQAS